MFDIKSNAAATSFSPFVVSQLHFQSSGSPENVKAKITTAAWCLTPFACKSLWSVGSFLQSSGGSEAMRIDLRAWCCQGRSMATPLTQTTWWCSLFWQLCAHRPNASVWPFIHACSRGPLVWTVHPMLEPQGCIQNSNSKPMLIACWGARDCIFLGLVSV